MVNRQGRAEVKAERKIRRGASAGSYRLRCSRCGVGFVEMLELLKHRCDEPPRAARGKRGRTARTAKG